HCVGNSKTNRKQRRASEHAHVARFISNCVHQPRATAQQKRRVSCTEDRDMRKARLVHLFLAACLTIEAQTFAGDPWRPTRLNLVAQPRAGIIVNDAASVVGLTRIAVDVPEHLIAMAPELRTLARQFALQDFYPRERRTQFSWLMDESKV